MHAKERGYIVYFEMAENGEGYYIFDDVYGPLGNRFKSCPWCGTKLSIRKE
jgi:hypothetical protein